MPAQAFDDLEGMVAQALARLEAMTQRAEVAERKSRELDVAMARFAPNPDEGRNLLGRLKELEDENRDLRARIDDGRAGVERLIARIRFLENRS